MPLLLVEGTLSAVDGQVLRPRYSTVSSMLRNWRSESSFFFPAVPLANDKRRFNLDVLLLCFRFLRDLVEEC